MDSQLEDEVEKRVEALGFDLVELEQAGSKTRPILRIRIDRSQASATERTSGVTVEDCTKVSRAVEAFLDESDRVSERYVLEVSSPGIERPLIKPQDYERFAGKKVAVKTSEAVGEFGKRVEGTLRGISGDVVMVDVEGKPIEIARGNIKKAHLVFEWKEKK